MPVSKPPTLPEWATDGGADIDEPSLGIKQEGWVAGELPPAGYFNWWQNLTYLWTQFLDDPDELTAVDVTATGTVSADVGVTAPFIVSETSPDIGHPNRTVLWSAADVVNTELPGPGPAGFIQHTGGFFSWGVNDDGAIFFVPIRLSIGKRLKSCTARVKPAGSGVWTLKLFKQADDGATTQVGSTDTSSGTSLQTLEVTGLSDTVAAGEAFFMEISTDTAALHVLFCGTYVFDQIAA